MSDKITLDGAVVMKLAQAGVRKIEYDGQNIIAQMANGNFAIIDERPYLDERFMRGQQGGAT